MSRMHSPGANAPRRSISEVFSAVNHGVAQWPVLAVLAAATAFGGCSSTQTEVSTAFTSLGSDRPSQKKSGGPMFPESKWGVSASRRVAADGDHIPKGGGRYKVGDPYQVGGRWYNPREQPEYDRVGIASWYGSDFHGRHTANGEIFDMNALTAAHPTLPMPSFAYVTNLSNERTILVRINDRGPYVGDRVIDLSRKSADALGLRSGGTGRVRVRYAGRAPLDGSDHHERQFLASRQWSGGTDIVALERAQSAREVAAYHRAPSPMMASPASENFEFAAPRTAPVRYPLRPSEPEFGERPDAGRSGYGSGYAPGRSYADAGPDAGRIWTPQEYRQAQIPR